MNKNMVKKLLYACVTSVAVVINLLTAVIDVRGRSIAFVAASACAVLSFIAWLELIRALRNQKAGNGSA